MFKVLESHYSAGNREEVREVDFVLRTVGGQVKRCEVKLMGKGNPEGADSTFARSSDVFIASKLSKTNIKQLEDQGVEWVELNQTMGFLKFGNVLRRLGVPHKPLSSGRDLHQLVEETVNQLNL